MNNTKKPNILVIITDQQQSGMMSCVGNKWLNTPNMDFIANCGVKFSNAYCTNPVCLASRFSMLTGLYPSKIGLKSNDFKNEVKEPLPEYIIQNGLGKLLKENNYKAFYGGKEHLPYMNTETLGFDYVSKDERYELAEQLSQVIEKTDEPFCMFASFINPHDICLMAIRDFAEETNNSRDEKIVSVCKTEIDEIEKIEDEIKRMDKNIFFKELCPTLPDNYEIAKDEPEAILFIQNQREFKKLARERYTDEDWRRHRYIYARLTEQVDEQIGIVLNAVKEKGIWDDTIIIFTSDHGDMDASHKMEHKTCLYNESVRVPFIIKDAKNSKGVSSALVSNGVDLIPTILDYAGIKKPEYLEGKSVKPSAENTMFKLRDTLLVESEFGKMVATENGAYHRYDSGKNNEQYYDNETNKGQMFNQINDVRYADEVSRLQEFLNRQ